MIAGSTWYSNGTRVGSATAGTTVGARAVAAVPNLSYQLVLARGGCADVVAVLNPATVTPTGTGLIGAVQGTVPATTAPGTYEVCFREVYGRAATGVAILAVG